MFRRCQFDPWVGKTPWIRKWQPTLVFLPKNPWDRGAWWATVHGLVKSQTRATKHTHSPCRELVGETIKVFKCIEIYPLAQQTG